MRFHQLVQLLLMRSDAVQGNDRYIYYNSYSVKVCNSIIDDELVVYPELCSIIRSNSEQIQATRLGLIVRLVRSSEGVGEVESRPVMYCKTHKTKRPGLGVGSLLV